MVPVGQGCRRRRPLAQDRLVGPGDALPGRALCWTRSARYGKRGSDPGAHPIRRPGGLRPDLRDVAPSGCSRSNRARRSQEPKPAPGRRTSTISRSRSPWSDRGPSWVAPSSLHREPQGPAGGPGLPGAPTCTPRSSPGAARHARHDRLPGPGAGGGDGLRGLQLRRGRGAATGDEPQALGGGDPRLRGDWPSSAAPNGVPERPRGPGPRSSASRLRISQGALGRLRPAGLPVHLAAGALPPRVPVRPAQRAADGLLSCPTTWCTRLSARGWRCCRRRGAKRRQMRGGAGLGEGRLAVRPRPGLRERRARAGRSRRWPRSVSGRGVASLGDLAGRSGASAETLGRLARAGACDALVDGPEQAAGGGRCGCSASRCPAPRWRRAPSSPYRSTLTRGRSCVRCRPGNGCWPTTAPRVTLREHPRADEARAAGRPAQQRGAREPPERPAVRVAGLVVARQRRPRPRGSPSCCSRTSTARST